jgi:serine phosphatase RsbU (regulator of sigma subunit)
VQGTALYCSSGKVKWKISGLRELDLGLNYGDQFQFTLEEIEMNLKENDMIVLYTDGITEAKNINLEDFGETKFERILLDNSNKTADEISNEVIKEITQFSKDNIQHDDITLVILKWKSRKSAESSREGQKFPHKTDQPVAEKIS